jgi:predicted GIY-YIG superfamily endonuclease
MSLENRQHLVILSGAHRYKSNREIERRVVEGSLHLHENFMTNRSRTLYTGVAGNLKQCMFNHKTGAVEGFASRYVGPGLCISSIKSRRPERRRRAQKLAQRKGER